MRKNFRLGILGLLAAVSCASTAYANLRAPHLVEYAASGALPAAGTGLIVEAETLTFAMGRPYSGDIGDVTGMQRHATIEARYFILSADTTRHDFEFIMADANPARVTINDQPATASEPVPMEVAAGHDIKPKRWKVRFSGLLQKGRNTITFSYRQPVSVREARHGYFTSSKWESYVEYELWPLKEWQLSPDFKLRIAASFEDDTPLLRRLLGRYNHTAQIVVPLADEAPWRFPALTGAHIERQDGKTDYRLELDRDFPDRIRVLSTELQQDGKNQPAAWQHKPPIPVKIHQN